MDESHCLPLTDRANQWNRFCPSQPAAVAFTVLFALTTTLHTIQAARLKTLTLSWTLIMGSAWELIAASTRVASIAQPTSQQLYEVNFVFLVLSPLWINAFDYVLLGRMVQHYGGGGGEGQGGKVPSLCGVSAKRLAIYFVVVDIACFIVQVGGALIFISAHQDLDRANVGLHLYTAGVVLQQVAVWVFLVLVVVFARRLWRMRPGENRSRGLVMTGMLLLSLVLITWRLIFRIVEFSAGASSELSRQINSKEWLVYVFDMGPMLIAIVIWHFYHPGNLFRQSPPSNDDRHSNVELVRRNL